MGYHKNFCVKQTVFGSLGIRYKLEYAFRKEQISKQDKAIAYGLIGLNLTVWNSKDTLGDDNSISDGKKKIDWETNQSVFLFESIEFDF